VTLAAWVVIAAGGAALGRLALPAAGLRGHYFTNQTRSGPPIAVTIDREVTTDTLDNGTAGIWPSYSVEWTGALVIDRAGTYDFATVSDDGSELEVADQVVVRNGGPHGPQEARGSIPLDAGLHPIRVRYEQAGGGFALAIRYAPAGQPLEPIPSARLLPDTMSAAEYRLRRMAPFASAALALLLWIAATRVLARRRAQLAPAVPRERAVDRPAVAIAIIVTVGVAMRIFMMLGSDAILWGDSEVFIETFGAIRNGRFFEHDSFRTLLYPYFLTAFLIWSGEPPMDQIIVGAQHMLGVVAAVCFFLAGRPVFGTRVALAGALLFTIHTTELFYEASILSEPFFVCVLAICLPRIVAFVSKPSVAGAVQTGCACVALTMTRPVAEWFVVVPLVIAAASLPTWGLRLKVSAVLVATVMIFILPWEALNQRQFQFFGVALGKGLGLSVRVFEIDRLDPPADTKYPELRDVLARGRATQFSPATFMRDELYRRRYSSAQTDELMYRFAMETAAAHPFRFAVNSLKQWYVQVGGSLSDEQICASAQGPYVCTPRTKGYAREPFLNRPRYEHEPVRPWVVAYFRHFRISMGMVFALAMFGMISFLAERRTTAKPGLFLALVIAYFTFLPAFAQSPQDRYRLPIDALLFMFAAFGAARLVQELVLAGKPTEAADYSRDPRGPLAAS
jgi:hypothetical protein